MNSRIAMLNLLELDYWNDFHWNRLLCENTSKIMYIRKKKRKEKKTKICAHGSFFCTKLLFFYLWHWHWLERRMQRYNSHRLCSKNEFSLFTFLIFITQHFFFSFAQANHIKNCSVKWFNVKGLSCYMANKCCAHAPTQ